MQLWRIFIQRLARFKFNDGKKLYDEQAEFRAGFKAEFIKGRSIYDVTKTLLSLPIGCSMSPAYRPLPLAKNSNVSDHRGYAQ